MKKLHSAAMLFALSMMTLPASVFAQGQGRVDVGAELENIAKSGGFGTGTASQAPEQVIGNLIQSVLAFLGVIALVLVVYAGVIWLTSGGAPDKVERAKKILAAAVMGLVIIFSSYAITGFVVNLLIRSVG